jgi:L-iditol 2-dehydrogenase
VKAAVFVGGGRLAAGEWARPVAGPGELLVRMRGCGLCGSDIAKILAPDTPSPLVLGHELVGDVVEAGPGADFFLGQRVVAAHHVPCGDCHYCRRGSESMCPAFKASHLDPGGFAEYVRIPAPNVRHATFRVPDGMADEVASFVEPLACCLRAVERAGLRDGDTVVVVGLGSIGCLFVQLSRRAGARVVGIDLVAERVRLARDLGAHAAGDASSATASVGQLSEGRGADHVIVTGGGSEVLRWAASLCRDGGAVHCFAGGAGETLPLPLDTLYRRELTLTTTYSSSPRTLAGAFALLTAGSVRVDALVTHRVSLAQLAEGVALVRRHEAVKVYVTP